LTLIYKLKERPNLKQALSNMSWLFADKAFRMVGGILVGAWVARYLGPAQVGQLNYAISLVTAFSSLALLGLGGIVIRKLITFPSITYETLGSAFVLQMLAGVLAAVLAILSAYILKPQGDSTIALVSILSLGLLLKASETFKYWFEARVQSKYTIWAESSAFCVSSALKVLLIVNAASLFVFAWVTVLELLLAAAALTWLYTMTGGKIGLWRYKPENAKDLLIESWPSLVSGTFVLLTMTMDRLVLMEYVSTTELGIYVAANVLVSTWYFVPVALGGSIAPRLTEMYLNNPKNYHSYVRWGYLCFGAVSGLLALSIFIGAELIIKILYGPAYTGAAQILRIMIWSVVFISIASLRGRLLIIEKKQTITLAITMYGLLFNVALLLLFVPIYGPIGAAYAFTLTWALNGMVMPFFFAKTRAHGFMAIGFRGRRQ
jgi:PST family polysaccharide transporter